MHLPRRSPALLLALLLACSRSPRATTGSDPNTAAQVDAAAAADEPAVPTPSGAKACGGVAGGPACFRFATPEDAFRFVLTKDPLILAIGEAHAQRGTEGIASSTKRFTESYLPMLAPRASDVVVELWAPDPKCMKAVKQVASAQAPVTAAQAADNQNEYLTLGNKAKEAGMTPWLLKPTCDDFTTLADAGDDAISAMLGLVKRLTQQRVTQLLDRSRGTAPQKMVVAYGGAMHNDLAPPSATKDYSFGPELDRLSGGRYVELDLIVPEFVKKTPTWEKLPWYPSFEADRVRSGDQPMLETTLYVVGERSFVIVFPPAAGRKPRP